MKINKIVLLTVLLALLFSENVISQDKKTIPLPAPDKSGGIPLMAAISKRRSLREFSEQPLPISVLSNLLWAANGVNDQTTGKRTAPSAYNAQEIDIYVSMDDGVYFYQPDTHQLVKVLDEDIQALTGTQKFVQIAPVNLIFVADYSRLDKKKLCDVKKEFFGATDTGFISQNVYLFCASEGLATVVRDWVVREPLNQKLKLRDDQAIILTQTVGYPATE